MKETILQKGVMTDLHQNYLISKDKFESNNLHHKAILIKKIKDWKKEDKNDEHELWEVEIIFDVSGREVPYCKQTTLHPAFIGLCANPPDYDPKKDLELSKMILSNMQKKLIEKSCKLKRIYLPKLPKAYMGRKKWVKEHLKLILGLEIASHPDRYNHEKLVVLSDEQLEDIFILFELSEMLNKR